MGGRHLEVYALAGAMLITKKLFPRPYTSRASSLLILTRALSTTLVKALYGIMMACVTLKRAELTILRNFCQKIRGPKATTVRVMPCRSKQHLGGSRSTLHTKSVTMSWARAADILVSKLPCRQRAALGFLSRNENQDTENTAYTEA